ncbi:tetratricopeptide repeat protein [Microvirga arabica]|uniref:Tetratricopeptide repeat protein n=1 Tax=Microvirga arabica TaxID=1128671 RepID=A0ABV6YAX4_9HYPH
MRVSWIIGGALLLASATGSAAAQPDAAYGAYQRGLYQTAFREATLRLEKNNNDAAAMTLLGELYNQGLGVAADPKKASEWYRLAAQRGDAHALAALGLMALDGRGMPKNAVQGRAWLEEAAAKGNPLASHNLALLLLTSESPADLQKAITLLKRAAEAEIPDAQHALGVLYLKGRGVERNPTEAARLFERAARNGSSVGEVEYAILLFNGDGVPASESQAARHFRRAAAKGNAIAQNRLARLLVAGRGVPANKVDAAAWHILAAAQGLADPWLDNALKDLTADERTRSEKLAAERLGMR